MSQLSLMAGPDTRSSAGRSRRATVRGGLYRIVAIVTTFAMLFGGLLLMPLPVTAQSEAVATARVNLRAEPSPDATILTVIPEGATVTVDGDPEAGFYPVTYNDTSGFASVDYIQIGGTPEETPADPAATPAAEEADAATVAAVTAQTPDSGGAPIGSAVANTAVICRVDASTGAVQITVVAMGQTIEITGAEVQAEGMNWTPVNCDGVGGFVASQYIGEAAPAETSQEQATEAVVPEVEVSEVPEVEVPEVPEVAVPEAPGEGTSTEAPADPAAAGTTEETEPATDAALMAQAPVSGGAPTGTAWVDVARLNFRSGPDLGSSVIAVLERGTAVELTGQQSNGFWEARALGTTGWLSAEFLTTSGALSAPTTPTPAPGGNDSSDSVAVGGTATGTARVTANLNLRSGPSTSYGVVTVLPSGATVELRGEPQSGFYPLSYNGTTGWAAGDWLDIGGSAPAPTPTPSPDSGSGSVAVGDSATGTASVTANLNLRSGPGTSYAVRTVMPAGSTVELRGAAQNGFYPLSFNGTTGWAAADWLSVGSAAPSPTPTPAPGGDGSVPVGNTSTGSATVTANLNLRSGPGTSYDVRTVMPAGSTVELRGGPQNGFYPLSYNGTTGWAAGDWLNVGSGPAPTPTPTPSPGGGDSVPVGSAATGTASVTANLNLRRGPATRYDVVTVMRAGATVELRGEPQSGFYPLSYNGTTGWAAADWLDIGGSAPAPTPTPQPGGGDSVDVGDTVTGTARTTAALNLRRGPTRFYEVITVMPAGATVELRGDTQNGYYPVSYNGTEGWAASGWLSTGGTTDPGSGTDGGAHPQYLYTEVAVNMRSQPTTSSSVVWVIPPGTRVAITGPMQNGWYPTRWAHVSGWMDANYLVESYSRPVPADKQWVVDIIYAAADRYGQPREDMLRVAQCESGLNPNAVNMDHANDNDRASGLFQFRPSTWATTPYADQNIFDATANANAAAWMWSVGRRNEWACQ